MLSTTLFDDIRGYMGGWKAWIVLATMMLVTTACNDATPETTLAPGTTATTTTAATTTSEATTTTMASTTTMAVTTTQDPSVRLAEIQARAKDVYVGRLAAIYNKDKPELLRWIGSQAIYDASVAAIDGGTIVFLQEPSHDNLTLQVDELLLDRSDCVVTVATASARGVLEGAQEPTSLIWIYWPDDTGQLVQGAVWQNGTPQSEWMSECDLQTRGVTP